MLRLIWNVIFGTTCWPFHLTSGWRPEKLCSRFRRSLLCKQSDIADIGNCQWPLLSICDTVGKLRLGGSAYEDNTRAPPTTISAFDIPMLFTAAGRSISASYRHLGMKHDSNRCWAGIHDNLLGILISWNETFWNISRSLGACLRHKRINDLFTQKDCQCMREYHFSIHLSSDESCLL